MARNAPTADQRPGALKPGRPSARPGLVLGLAVLLALSLAGNVMLALRRPANASAANRATPTPVATSAAPVAQATTRSADPVPNELLAYAGLGTYVAATNRIPDLGWSEGQMNAFVEGLRACYAGRPYPFDDAARSLRASINEKVQAMQGAAASGSDPIEDYFTMLRESEGVQRTASNLHYRMTIDGDGDTPTPDDTVVLSYAARLPGGERVPSLSRERLRVRVGDLLPGLREGLGLMKAGGKGLLYLPPSLSFGQGDWPAEVPAGTPIAFFVELHEVVRDDW